MSLIFGIYSQQSGEVGPVLNRMFGAMRHIPHEKYQVLAREKAGFGHLLTYNTPEALFEKQPVYDTEEQVLITSEARLDNRGQVAGGCGVRLYPEVPDGELIRQAWRKWGKGCVHHLQGDWSFAVYDEREQELFLARDPHGYTAVYYYQDGETLVFASSPKAILAVESFRKRVNMRHFLGGLLIWPEKDTNTEIYEDLYNVPPGHTLSFKGGKVELSRYWFPENTPLRKYKDPRDYAEELREIFAEAVRVRLRSYRPVASMLSGGLDSGSVSAIAAHLLKQEEKVLSTFSHVPHFREEVLRESGGRRLADETPHILSVTRHAGNIEPVLLDSARISPVEGIIEAVEKTGTCFHGAGNAFWLMDLPGEVAQRGYGALLSGEMGNATISYPGVSYLLPWYHRAAASSVKGWLKHLAKPLVLQYFPGYFRRRKNGLLDYIRSSFVQAHFREEAEAAIRKEETGFSRYYPDAAAGMLHLLDVGHNPRCRLGQLIGDEFGVEFRDPTGDINVITYCLSVSNDAFFGDSLRGKQVLKNMMQGYLPDDVLYSTRKGLQASDLKYRLIKDAGGVEELLNRVCSDPQAAEVLDTGRLRGAWTAIRQEQPGPVIREQTFVKTLMYGYFLTRLK